MSEPAARRVKCKFSVRVVDAQSDEALRLRVPFAAEATVAEFKKEILIRAKKKAGIPAPGGKFDYQVPFVSLAEAPPIVWRGAPAPSVGPWAPPGDARPRAASWAETASAARDAAGPSPAPGAREPARGGGAGEAALARGRARGAGRERPAGPRGRGGAGGAARRAARRRSAAAAAAALAEAKCAQARRSGATKVVLDVANIGHHDSPPGAVRFSWNQVAAAFAYYATRRSFDVRGFLSFHTHRKNEYPPLEEFAWRDKITIHHCSFVTDDNLRGWEDRLGGEDAAFLQIFRNDLHIMYVFVAGEFLPDKPPWEFLRAGEALPAPAPHTARDAAAAEAALWAAREPVVACRVLAFALGAAPRATVAHLRRAGGDDVPRRARGLRAARAGAARARDLPGLRRRRAAPRRRRRPLATLEGLRFEPGEIVGVLDLGDHHAMVLDAASGAGATLFERDRRRAPLQRVAAARAVAGDDLGRAGDLLASLLVARGRSAPRARARRRSSTGGAAATTASTRGVFEDVDLVDQSEVMPYKGQRLLRPVRLEGSSKVYSYAAVAEGFGAGEGGWADTRSRRRPPPDRRWSAPPRGKDALLLTAAARAAPLQRPGGRALAETYERDCRDRSSPLRVATPVELKDAAAPRPALLYDASGHLVVCESCGTTQADKGAGGGTTTELSIYSTHTGARCVVEADKLALAHATLGPKRLPLAGAGGVAVRSATLIIVDCSESMGGEFRRYEDEKGDVDAYENPELDVWRALIAAPAYSDWARGAFELCVAFGDGYPHEPPTVTFVTPILHPNVDARTGRACHAILGTAWHSEMRALDVIVAVRSLLMAPEPSDALDQSVALRFRDKKNWAEEVKEHVKEHASRSLDELQEAVDADDDDDDDDDDDGSGPVCPLTQARAPRLRFGRRLRRASAARGLAAAGDLPHDPVMTEAAGETVILDPLMLDFCPVARPEDKRIAQLRIAEADAADAADASDSDDDAAAAITTPAPVEDPLAMWRCYCCERPIMRLEVVACPTCRLATYCSETCCADHAGDHAHFCRPREIAKDDDVVATAEAGLAEAVAALQRGDAPGCRTEVLAALDALAGALPPSAFLSADAFNIPDKIRGLFFDLNNLGAKAEQIWAGDARFESTPRRWARSANRRRTPGNRSSRLDAHWASFTAVGPAVCVAQSM
ncbi:hypothetical protein JL720_5355 [Aureococcus anophagefferens]|nr:hypothetical protein JL720_5355 [Aureococcus anophagefferens]